MPLFYFHVRDCPLTFSDHEGMELPDLTAALAEARAAAREIAADELQAGRPVLNRCFEIADPTGQVLATIAFRDVLSDR